MNFPPKLKIGIIIVLVITVFIILNFTGFSKGIKNFFYLISTPIQKKFWQAGDSMSDFFEGIFRAKSLKEENENLKLRNQELLSRTIALENLKNENQILREALEIGLEKEFKLAFAEIIGKEISQDLILINKGSKDGLSEGLPVITQQKVLSGKIQEVYKDFSKVMLITNKESTIDVKISEKEIYGVVKGQGNFRIYLDLIPQEKEIQEGDLVITTSLGGIFPKGLLVGLIKEVKKSDIEPFQQAEISPLFDIKETESLFIITSF